ncbi:MAG: hypothetical protein ABJG75_04320 [Roseobacter sp.]
METPETMKIKFGETLGESLFVLEPKIQRLQHDWQVYRSFFGANKERWDFLHEAGGVATMSIESALWDSVILSLCRLTDVQSSSNHQLATLHQLSPKRVTYSDASLGRSIKKAIKEAVTATEPVREIRRNRVAHANLEVALGQRVVDQVSRAQIEEAVNAISKPLKLIYAGICDTDILDCPPIGSSDSAVKLLNSLYLGTTVDRSTVDRSNYPNWLMFGEWDR